MSALDLSRYHVVTAVALPDGCAIASLYPATHLADAYAVQLPAGTTTDPEQLARFIFSQQAPWIGLLMKLRDALVVGFGLKTAAQLATLDVELPAGRSKRVGIFKIYNTSANEIVLGEDDRHLDFRLSLLCSASSRDPFSVPSMPAGVRQLTLSTVVHCHNRLGRLYILLIAPFHRLVVQSSLRRAARLGWPQATDTATAAVP